MSAKKHMEIKYGFRMGFMCEEEWKGETWKWGFHCNLLFLFKKEASEANGQNVYIYLIFMKDMKAFVLFSIFFRMLEIISYENN